MPVPDPPPAPGSLDITEGGAASPGAAPRPWIQVFFRCSGQYLRVFRHHDGSGYQARCAACGKCLRFRTAPGGTEQRRFEVDCRR